MRTLTITALFALMSIGLAYATVCETTCSNNQYYGSGSSNCTTRCHH